MHTRSFSCMALACFSVIVAGALDYELTHATPIDPPTWTEVTPAVSPSARGYAEMVDDIARERVVLFGGSSSTGYEEIHHGDTWEWDGTGWIEVTPAVSPPARGWHAMAYDSVRNRVILMGGEDETVQALDDMWKWDGSTWVEITPAVNIPARLGHAIAYDSARDRVVAFSGQDFYGVVRADTWEYDGVAWVEVTPAVSPPAQINHSMVYDSARGVVVLVGNGMWEYDGNVWVDVTPAVSPPSSAGYGLVYDSARGRVVLVASARIWEWDGAVWAEVIPSVSPPHRHQPDTAYDSTRDRVVLFGGYMGGGTYANDTWEYTPLDPQPCEDLDSDGFGSPGAASCPEGDLEDCDDLDPAVHPGATELCDGLDNDCDGVIPPDETDADNDSWSVCMGDCDDADPLVNPVQPEECNGMDDNCDGVVSGEDDDGDGYLGCGDMTDLNSYDCNDQNPLVYPTAPAICDGLTNDCRCLSWECVQGAPGCTCHAEPDWDTDGDGYSRGCDGDCDDLDVGIHPGASETCNQEDDDCDGQIDEGLGMGPVLVALEPNVLWPPNHRMVEIDAQVAVQPGCGAVCPAPVVVLTSVASNEPDDAPGGDDGYTAEDIQDVGSSPSGLQFSLRAERNGTGGGRVYTATYTASDCEGSTRSGSAYVVVPHDQGGHAEPLALEFHEDASGAETLSLSWSAVAGASSYNVMRGSLSSTVTTGSYTVMEGAECMAEGTTALSLSGGPLDEEPDPGEAFLYLVEYLKGGNSGYGTESSGRELLVATGDSCR